MGLFESLRTTDTQAQFWGACFAALFSIAVLVLTRAVSSVTARKRKHYDCLVRFEGMLNQHLSRSYMNVYILEGVVKTTKSGHISWNNMASLTLNHMGDAYYDLVDAILINSVFNYNQDVDRLNADLENMNDIYSELRSAIINGTFKASSMQAHYPNLLNDLNALIKGWENHIEVTVELAAQIRLALPRDKSRFTSIKHWFLERQMKPLGHDAVLVEKEKLMQEVEAVRQASRKNIEKIYGK